MSEEQIAALQKLFPNGCFIVWRRPGEIGIEGEPISVYLYDPNESPALGVIADNVFSQFGEPDDEDLDEDEDLDDVDEDNDEDDLVDEDLDEESKDNDEDDLGIFRP